MRKTLATKQPVKDSNQQKLYGKAGVRLHHNILPFSTSQPLLQRQCACGGGCPRCQENLDSIKDTDGDDEVGTETPPLVGHDARVDAGGTEPAPLQSDAGTPAPAATPCPTSVSIGQISQFNHSNLSASDQQEFRTYLGAVSRMDVGPGSDHSGHCMKEFLTTVSNTCPAAVYNRGGTTTEPCTGNRCLDINRGSSLGDSRTSTMLRDGPTSFIDLHRTLNRSSLLEGTTSSSCDVVCEQIYKCDRTGATTGRFHITRHYQAGTMATGDGGTQHITTGTVTKVAQP
jgi:hypothetical protein